MASPPLLQFAKVADAANAAHTTALRELARVAIRPAAENMITYLGSRFNLHLARVARGDSGRGESDGAITIRMNHAAGRPEAMQVR